MFGHSQFSSKLYADLLKTCGVEQLQQGVTDKRCEDLLDQMDRQIGGYYGYDLYDDCGAENVLSSWREATKPDAYLNRRRRQQRVGTPIPSAHVSGGHPCGGTGAMLEWLNVSDVKESLHVPADAFFFLTDNGVGFNYSVTEPNLMPFYKRVAQNTSLRTLVYNGDTDPGITLFDAGSCERISSYTSSVVSS